MAVVLKHEMNKILDGCDKATASNVFLESYSIMVKLKEVVELMELYKNDDSYEVDLCDALTDCQFNNTSCLEFYIKRLCPLERYRMRLMYRAFIDKSSKLYVTDGVVKSSDNDIVDSALLQKFSENACIIAESYTITEEEFDVIYEEIIELLGTLGDFLLEEYQLGKSYVSLHGVPDGAENKSVIENEGAGGSAVKVNAFAEVQPGELVIDECVKEALAHMEDDIDTILENVRFVSEHYKPALTLFEINPGLHDPFVQLLTDAGYTNIDNVDEILPVTIECVEDIQRILEAPPVDAPEMMKMFVDKYDLLL